MAKMLEDVEAKETITIGDKVYDKDAVTASVYFEYVKGLKQKFDFDDQNIVIDTALKMLEKAKLTGQTSMAKELTHQVELALREMNAARDGFDIFIDRKDVERYIEKISNKAVKIIELEQYEREIPDSVIDKLVLAKKHFDAIYVVFTDYTMKETKKVAKERRDKDPVLFGVFHDKDEDNHNNIYVEDRMFFIADWVEEKCDLTLEEIVRDTKEKDKKDITYKVVTPEDEDSVKAMLKSYNKPIEESYKPISLFEKIKKKVTRKKKEESTEEQPKKRGRKKKVEE